MTEPAIETHHVAAQRSFGELARTLTADEWATPAFAAAIASMGEIRPPIDCHTHEHDVCHAVARPGNRTTPIVEAAVASAIRSIDHRLVFELSDGRTLRSDGGPGRPVAPAGVSPFEVFRSRLGRRSAAQVEAYDWSGSAAGVAAVLDAWFIFGPSQVDVVE